MSVFTDAINQGINDNAGSITALVEGMPTVQKVNHNLNYIVGGLAVLLMINIATLIIVKRKK